MKKQVGKSSVFTKESLSKIQDKIRLLSIESFNKEYQTNYKLKPKLKGMIIMTIVGIIELLLIVWLMKW